MVFKTAAPCTGVVVVLNAVLSYSRLACYKGRGLKRRQSRMAVYPLACRLLPFRGNSLRQDDLLRQSACKFVRHAESAACLSVYSPMHVSLYGLRHMSGSISVLALLTPHGLGDGPSTAYEQQCRPAE